MNIERIVHLARRTAFSRFGYAYLYTGWFTSKANSAPGEPLNSCHVKVQFMAAGFTRDKISMVGQNC